MEKTPPEIDSKNEADKTVDSGTGHGTRHEFKSPFIVRKSQDKLSLNLKEIWSYHELLYFLTWRDIKVRYKQTALGIIWAVLQPFMTIVVFTIFFGKLAGISTDGFPGPVFYLSGLLPWQLFANALSTSSNSLVTNRQLITKVYFPRLIIPISSILAGVVDFIIAFILLIVIMLYYGVVPSATILLLPIFIILAVLTSFAASLWLSALNVRYRDVRFTIPFLTQIWLFVTPIVYPSSLVPEKFRIIYGLNPMAGIVEGFRWAILGESSGAGPLMIVSGVIVIVMLIGGLYYFKRTERTFADIV